VALLASQVEGFEFTKDDCKHGVIMPGVSTKVA
jgi:hypothetical protein